MSKPELVIITNVFFNYLSYLEYLTALYNHNPFSIENSPLKNIVLKFRKISFGSKLGEVGNKFFIWSVFHNFLSESDTPEKLNTVYKNNIINYVEQTVDLISSTIDGHFMPIWEKHRVIIDTTSQIIQNRINRDVLAKISKDHGSCWPDKIIINLAIATASGTSYGYPLTILAKENVPEENILESIIHELVHFIDLTDTASTMFFKVFARKMSQRKVAPIFLWMIKHAWIYYYSGEFLRNHFNIKNFVPAYARRNNKCSSIENIFIEAIKNRLDGSDPGSMNIDQHTSVLCDIGEKSHISIKS